MKNAPAAYFYDFGNSDFKPNISPYNTLNPEASLNVGYAPTNATFDQINRLEQGAQQSLFGIGPNGTLNSPDQGGNPWDGSNGSSTMSSGWRAWSPSSNPGDLGQDGQTLNTSPTSYLGIGYLGIDTAGAPLAGGGNVPNNPLIPGTPADVAYVPGAPSVLPNVPVVPGFITPNLSAAVLPTASSAGQAVPAVKTDSGAGSGFGGLFGGILDAIGGVLGDLGGDGGGGYGGGSYDGDSAGIGGFNGGFGSNGADGASAGGSDPYDPSCGPSQQMLYDESFTKSLSGSNMFFGATRNGHARETAWAGASNGVPATAAPRSPVSEAIFTLWDPAADSGTAVVLDLSGKGIDIAPLSSSNVFLDMANNGYAQRTAWAGAGNGVLVYDPSGGAVTQANQVDFTLWDPAAATNMQALKDVFDTNHDGVLNASDFLGAVSASWRPTPTARNRLKRWRRRV